MILSDKQIRDRGIVVSNASNPVDGGFIGFGYTSYGYDARCTDEVWLVGYESPAGHKCMEIDPKNFSKDILASRLPVQYPFDQRGKFVVLPPHSFVLSETMERFRIPRDVLAVCVGKSTYARCGLILNVTPLEPEWEGTVTIEISNTTNKPAKLYVEEGVMQVIFHKCDELCERSYADKRGKYQNQSGVTFPRVRK